MVQKTTAGVEILGPFALEKIKELQEALNEILPKMKDCFVSYVEIKQLQDGRLLAYIFYKETEGKK